MRIAHLLPTLSRTALLATLIATLPSPGSAEVRLPKVFGSHMVLQQQQALTFWGWAEPNETVAVQLDAEKRQAQANERGEWKIVLPAMKAAGPYALTVSGSSRVEFEDIMVGEVWLCSGQSNMEMGVGGAKEGKAEIAAANYPNIRLLLFPERWTAEPQTNVEATWKVCSPKTIAEGGWNGFSAAGYFFGRELHKELGVAVGLIEATWGGTRIESWTPPEGFAAVPALKREYELVQLGDPRTAAHQQRLEQILGETEHWLASARQALTSRTLVPAMPTYPAELLPPHDREGPTALYNGMIHPLHPLPLRGAIWYQGEANAGEGAIYAEKMKALVGGWRQVWGEGDFPFYFVQIAPFSYGGNAQKTGEFWEAQAAAAGAIPNSGMVVINDIGNLKDIHPIHKQEVGHRLALWALAKTYGRPDLIYSGPVFKAMAIEGDKLRLSFDHVAGGLSSRDGNPLTWFEIIDADEGPFVKADARIDAQTVVLSAPEVKHPVAMRFAWSLIAEPNLVNSAGLPTGAFRAGTVPKRDLLTLNVPEAKDYQLVYDVDLAKLGPDFSYDANNCAGLQKPFDRVAYFLELAGANGDVKYLYVSMDAFTDSLDKIGVPTFKSGAHFQQNVANMNVYSNAKGVVTGSGLKGGNIEFWPNNYVPNNSTAVPNASDQTFDFGDQPTDPSDGYGSMQVHNHEAKQTLFALNHWREGSGADLGIGNQPKGNPDWTFASNAGSYETKRLRILVRCK
ncbi:MAG TPA: sialate O-acetylesterase [Candidatus Binatia bacterium]|jgi:sialate O-acetylesterase|nr:sialate O-acetylesterase [Candidatus Binatia bacterium]